MLLELLPLRGEEFNKTVIVLYALSNTSRLKVSNIYKLVNLFVKASYQGVRYLLYKLEREGLVKRESTGVYRLADLPDDVRRELAKEVETAMKRIVGSEEKIRILHKALMGIR